VVSIEDDRSKDGQTLVISSQDGYCSIVAFDPLELGTPYSGPSPLPSVSHVPSAQIPPVHSPVKSITPIKAPFFPATTTAIDLPTPVQDQASTSASNKREGAVLVVEDDDELIVVEEGPPKKKRAALTFVGALGGGNSK
jgi:chromatin assembly factor 1 subunit B